MVVSATKKNTASHENRECWGRVMEDFFVRRHWAERSEKDMVLNWMESWRKSIVSRRNNKCKAFAWCHQRVVEMSDWSLINRGRQVRDEVRSGRAFCHDKHFCILYFGGGLMLEKSDQDNDSNQIQKDHCVLFIIHSFTKYTV